MDGNDREMSRVDKVIVDLHLNRAYLENALLRQYGYCGLNRADVEDLTSEAILVMISVIRAGKSLDFLEAYLRRVAVNMAKNLIGEKVMFADRIEAYQQKLAYSTWRSNLVNDWRREIGEQLVEESIDQVVKYNRGGFKDENIMKLKSEITAR